MQDPVGVCGDIGGYCRGALTTTGDLLGAYAVGAFLRGGLFEAVRLSAEGTDSFLTGAQGQPRLRLPSTGVAGELGQAVAFVGGGLVLAVDVFGRGQPCLQVGERRGGLLPVLLCAHRFLLVPLDIGGTGPRLIPQTAELIRDGWPL